MANRTEHLKFGALSGPAYGLVTSAAAGRSFPIPEAVGFSISATLGAALPDVLEPAYHPNHRSTFHSLLFFGAAAFIVGPWIEQERTRQHQLAQQCRCNAASGTNSSPVYWAAFFPVTPRTCSPTPRRQRASPSFDPPLCVYSFI